MTRVLIWDIVTKDQNPCTMKMSNQHLGVIIFGCLLILLISRYSSSPLKASPVKVVNFDFAQVADSSEEASTQSKLLRVRCTK